MMMTTMTNMVGQDLNPAWPGLVKPGRHSLITGLARLRLAAKAQKPKSRPGQEPDRQSGAFEVTTVDVIT